MRNAFRRGAFGLSLALCVLATTGSRVADNVGGGDGPVPLSPDPILSSFFVPLEPGPVMDAVADKFEVHHRLPGGFEVIVPADRADELRRLVPAASLLEADIHAELKSLSREQLAGYHDFTKVEEHLRRIADEHPRLAKLDTYGKSKEGRPLFVLTLTGRAAGEKKDVMITSATHGDELISVEVVMGLLDKLVDGYESDVRLTRILDTRVLHFIPVVNPDGYVRRSRYANGVDPNREYPYPTNPNRRPNECIQAVMDYFDARNIAGSADFHSSGGMYMYPWSYTQQPVPQEDYRRFETTTAKMARTNGYRHGQIPKLLYIAKGGSADYYYWKKKSLSIGVEIGNSNVPPVSQIPQHVDANAEALWIFLESV